MLAHASLLLYVAAAIGAATNAGLIASVCHLSADPAEIPRAGLFAFVFGAAAFFVVVHASSGYFVLNVVAENTGTYALVQTAAYSAVCFAVVAYALIGLSFRWPRVEPRHLVAAGVIALCLATGIGVPIVAPHVARVGEVGATVLPLVKNGTAIAVAALIVAGSLLLAGREENLASSFAAIPIRWIAIGHLIVLAAGALDLVLLRNRFSTGVPRLGLNYVASVSTYLGFTSSLAVLLVRRRRALHDPRLLARALASRFGLSARELEVTTLVAAGLANREIGERLFISVATVKNHLHSIFSKTGASNRNELVRLFASGPRPQCAEQIQSTMDVPVGLPRRSRYALPTKKP